MTIKLQTANIAVVETRGGKA